MLNTHVVLSECLKGGSDFLRPLWFVKGTTEDHVGQGFLLGIQHLLQTKRRIIMAKRPATKPAFNPEDREKQLISLAVDQVQRQLEQGTASQAVLLHFLKLGTESAKLERELLKNKSEQIQTQSKSGENYKEALEAFKGYAPQGNKNDQAPD